VIQIISTYMHAGESQHEKSQLFPHFKPLVQPVGEVTIFSASPQLNVCRKQTWRI